MKKTILSLIMTVAIVSVTFGQEKRYGIERAILKKNTIMVDESTLEKQSFSAVQYIADYGRKEAVETSMDVQGQEFTVSVIMKDGYAYSANMALGQGIKTNMVAMGDFKAMNFLDLTDEVKEKYQMEEKENEQFLGKDCKRYNMTITINGVSMNGAVWEWQGLSLRTYMSHADIIVVEEVTEIQEGAEIAEEKFELPEGIDFIEITPPLFQLFH